MVPTKRTVGRYVYTLGVLFTGSFLTERVGGFDGVLLWGALFVAAALWVAYYTYVVIPRFEYLSARDDGDGPEEPDPPDW